jgi:hypothetical protein
LKTSMTTAQSLCQVSSIAIVIWNLKAWGKIGFCHPNPLCMKKFTIKVCYNKPMRNTTFKNQPVYGPLQK